MQTIDRWMLAMFVLPVALGGAAAHADPQPDESTTIYLGSLALRNHSRLPNLSGAGVPPGLNLNVGNAESLAFALEHRSGPNWGVELALGVPPRVGANAAGAAWTALGMSPGAHVVRASAFSPTLYLNHHFGDGAIGWDPFVGVGLNYTHFQRIHSSGALNGSALGPSSVKLGDSWGPAAQAGVVYHFERNWSLLASLAIVQVRSDLTASSPQAHGGPVTATSRIDFGPQIYKVAIGYSF